MNVCRLEGRQDAQQPIRVGNDVVVDEAQDVRASLEGTPVPAGEQAWNAFLNVSNGVMRMKEMNRATTEEVSAADALSTITISNWCGGADCSTSESRHWPSARVRSLVGIMIDASGLGALAPPSGLVCCSIIAL